MATKDDRMGCATILIGYFLSTVAAVFIGIWLFDKLNVHSFLTGVLWFMLWSFASSAVMVVIMLLLMQIEDAS